MLNSDYIFKQIISAINKCYFISLYNCSVDFWPSIEYSICCLFIYEKLFDDHWSKHWYLHTYLLSLYQFKKGQFNTFHPVSVYSQSEKALIKRTKIGMSLFLIFICKTAVVYAMKDSRENLPKLKNLQSHILIFS